MKKLFMLLMAFTLVFVISGCGFVKDEETLPELIGITIEADLDNIEDLYVSETSWTLFNFASVSAAEEDEFDADANQEMWLVVHMYHYDYEINGVEIDGQWYQYGDRVCTDGTVITEEMDTTCSDSDEAKYVALNRTQDRVQFLIPIIVDEETDTTKTYTMNQFRYMGEDEEEVNQDCDGEKTQTRLYTHKAMPGFESTIYDYDRDTGILTITIDNPDNAELTIKINGTDLILTGDMLVDGSYVVDCADYFDNEGNGNSKLTYQWQWHNGSYNGEFRSEEAFNESQSPVITVTSAEGVIYVPYDGTFDITEYYTAEDNIDGNLTADVAVTYLDMEANVITEPTEPGHYVVDLLVVDQAGNEGINSIDLMLGTDIPVLFELTALEAEAVLREFYDDIFVNLSISEVCTKYADIPFEWTITETECNEDLPNVLEIGITSYVADNTTVLDNVYTSTVTFNGDHVITVQYSFIGYEYGEVYYFNLLTDPFQFPGGGEMQLADLTEAEALVLVQKYYIDLLDVSISDIDFCAVYGFINLSAEGFGTEAECIANRIAAQTYLSYAVLSLTFHVGINGVPDLWKANIDRDGTSVDSIFLFTAGDPVGVIASSEVESFRG